MLIHLLTHRAALTRTTSRLPNRELVTSSSRVSLCRCGNPSLPPQAPTPGHTSAHVCQHSPPPEHGDPTAIDGRCCMQGTTTTTNLCQSIPEHLQMPPQLINPRCVHSGRLRQHIGGGRQPVRQPAQRQQQAGGCRQGREGGKEGCVRRSQLQMTAGSSSRTIDI